MWSAPWPHDSGSSFRRAARPLCTTTSGGATSSSGATAAHGSSTRPCTAGYPQEDLAILALFGVVPDRLLHAYAEVHPLQTGWQERSASFQLAPLLVHAVLFGGGYRAEAEAVARRFA